MMKKKTITIREDQEKWLKTFHINLSRLVQDAIDKEMEKFKDAI